MGIEYEIHRPQKTGFRRAFIKRRSNTTGQYEASWFEITDFVKKWGSIERTIDDIRLNRFVHSGFNMTVRNDTGAFNTEENANSLWFSYMTRYRTLFKIEGGYTTDADAELPTVTSLGVFIASDEIPISAVSNSATFRLKSLVSVFDEVRATDVAGLGATQTADQLIARVRDHTDGSGNFYFRQFITSTAWTIMSTTNVYNFATSTALGSITVWEFMEKLAESEGFLLLINREGGLEFRDRLERTSTAAFDFRGLGFNDPNVLELQEYKESYNKLFTFFRMKWLSADTTTSYAQAGSTASVDPSSSAWKYGSRVYNFENLFVANTASALNIVDDLNQTFSAVKEEVTIKTVFVPQLEISDRVALSYRSYALEDTTLWGQFLWGVNVWASEEGENFDWNQQAFKIISIQHDLTNFTTTFNLREL